MGWFSQYLTSFMIFIPTVASLLVFLAKSKRQAEILALVGSFACFVLSIIIWLKFNPYTSELQFVEQYEWVPSLGLQYFVGIDGLNLLLLVLTTFLSPLVILSLEKKTPAYKEFLVLLLLLETGMLGALCAFDMVFFYVFWEAMLIPMYFIIGLWGGENKIYATTKFVIYTVFGSLLMLVAAIFLYITYWNTFGTPSTSILDLYRLSSLPFETQSLLFLAFAIAFAIKVPMWPFHTWLPHAHTEAPTAGSVILAGVLLKMGGYGFLRLAIPLFPLAFSYFASSLAALAIIGIIYGALTAWYQKDAKKLVAYSSVSHLGFVVLGSVATLQASLSEEALMGAVYQMINHGISTGALFFLVGIIYERRHTRMLVDFGGLAKVMPAFACMLIVATLGSVALPGTGGFVGEFLILLGTFTAHPLWAVLACSGVVLGAIYMLSFCLKILFGPLDNPKNQELKDLSIREWSYLTPLAILIFLMGIYPNLFLDKIKVSVHHLAKNYQHYELNIFEQQKHSPSDFQNLADLQKGVQP